MAKSMAKDVAKEPVTDQPRSSPTGSSAAMGRTRSIKGRGATLNMPSRYLTQWSERDAEVSTEAEPEFAPGPVNTELYADRTVTLITRNRSPDIPFDRSINAYKGCEHGCVYCFARPTHAYLDLSPGIDFETRIFYKTRVRERLEAELARPGYQCAPIALGTNTDPYQPAERRLRNTRTVLEVLNECRHPVTIVTKSQLILDDLDLLRLLADQNLVRVMVSVTTLDNGLKTRLEPRTASPAARLRVLATLAEAGVPVGAMVAPVIPCINDHELERIVAAVVDAGAADAGYILLRLPLEVADLFRDWLAEHFPDRAGKVMNVIRSMRGGKDYRSEWGRRMRGTGPYADLIAARFRTACKRNGLAARSLPDLDTSRFRPRRHSQPDLFD